MLRGGYWSLAAVFSVLLISPSMAQSQPQITLGIYEGLSKKFPESKGLMWSDRILSEVYRRAGYTITLREYPARRLAMTLARGDIDVYISSEESVGRIPYQDKFIRSELPASIVTWYIYYNQRKNWVPTWPPDNFMREKIGKSRQSSESLKTHWGLQVTQSASTDAMVKMVNLGRADYWIDNRSGLRSVTPGLLKSPDQGFIYAPLFARGLYFYFQKEAQGKKLAAVFNAGFKQLLSNGKYRQSYHIGDPNPELSDTVDQSIQYFKANYPGLIIAPQ